jgi:hypothetical protein
VFGKTQEALRTSEQILVLDPQNCEAAHAQWLMTSSSDESKN